MSKSAKEVVAECYKASIAGDLEAVKGFLDPKIRVIEADGLPYGGVWEGIDGFFALMDTVFGMWKDCRIDVQRLVADGEWVVSLLEMSGAGVKSGIAFRMPMAEVFRVLNGRIVEIIPYYFDTKLLHDIHEDRQPR
jgi:ketosteroid isomerase-like protein